jgi:hypothetical protein
MPSFYDRQQTDLGFLKYLLPLIPGIAAALVLLDYHGIIYISYLYDMDIEQKMIYLAYAVITMSLIIFLYFFRIGDNNRTRW